jgi:hypothetical protein
METKYFLPNLHTIIAYFYIYIVIGRFHRYGLLKVIFTSILDAEWHCCIWKSFIKLTKPCIHGEFVSSLELKDFYGAGYGQKK